MSLESALAQYWQHDTGLRALVGTRIYPLIAPQGAVLPYLTWQRLSWQPTYHMTGRSNLVQCTVQLDCWGRTNPEVTLLAEALLAACDATYYGAMAELDIRSMTVLNDLDVPETPDDGGQVGVFHRALDLEIWYRLA